MIRTRPGPPDSPAAPPTAAGADRRRRGLGGRRPRRGRPKHAVAAAASLALILFCRPSLAEPLSPAEVADVERFVTSNLRPAYGAMLAKAGSTLSPGSAGWDDSLHRTVSAMLSRRPADCPLAIWIAGGCGRHLFDVPSKSMLPTVLDHDVVSTLRPEAARPVRRGDVVAYRVPPDPNAYMHRVIGLPGDRISLVDGSVEVDGRRLPREPAGGTAAPRDDGGAMVEYVEHTPDGRGYRVLWPSGAMAGVHGAEMHAVVVPPGHVFVMGDDRSLSLDSRPPDGHGMPALADVVGVAQTVVLSREPARIGAPL